MTTFLQNARSKKEIRDYITAGRLSAVDVGAAPSHLDRIESKNREL